MANSQTFKIGYFQVVESQVDGAYRINVKDSRTGNRSAFDALSLMDYDGLLTGLESDPSIACLRRLTEQFQGVDHVA